MSSNKMRLFGLVLLLALVYSCIGEDTEKVVKWPTVGFVVLVRNKALTLPYFLTCLYNLDYPKNRIHIWFYSDYNSDKSDEILTTWVENYKSKYNGIYLGTDNTTQGKLHPDQERPHMWTPLHFEHVIKLREQGLEYMRKKWAHYMFMIDADAFLTDTLTLKALVRMRLPVVAPMLVSDGIYSNYWCGMSDNFYYERTDEYMPILTRERTGCFDVPMVHTAVLVDLDFLDSDMLSYYPPEDVPTDDIIAFAINAKRNGFPLRICNDRQYGFIPIPMDDYDDIMTESEQFLNVKMEALGRHVPLPLDKLLAPYVRLPEPWKFDCDEVYMINLERRPERRELMDQSFKELGMTYKLFKAVDGRALNMEELQEHSITLMPGYEDPYHHRPMKAGEVGCFLSHYYIWKEIVKKEQQLSLVLEDDIHFTAFFRYRFYTLMEEIKDMEWDLVYIGRKILSEKDEEYVSNHTTRPSYSYWTLGYLLRLSGARKLLRARPLEKMLPVDEYLPIMFDKHPNDTWKSYFPERNLIALSSAPLLVHPTHYTGQEGYISDTEDSSVVTTTPAPTPNNEL